MSERGLRSSAATASLLVLLALLLAALERRIVPADSAVVVQRRLALVVGNQNYRTTPLTNPRNDGAAVAATLRRLGFDDVTERYDVTRREMDDATAQFAGRLRASDLALFYHRKAAAAGLQKGKENLKRLGGTEDP